MGDNELECSKCCDRKDKIAFRTSKYGNRYGKKQTANSIQMLLSPRKNGLDSLFKEVAVFKALDSTSNLLTF